MRTLSSELLSAQGNVAYRPAARLKIYPARAFWQDFTTSNFPASILASSFDQDVRGDLTTSESVTYTAATNKIATAFNYNGVIYLTLSDANNTILIASSAMAAARPAIYDYSGLLQVYYQAPDSTIWKRTYSPTLGTLGVATQFSSWAPQTPLAIHPLGNNSIAVFYKKNSGVGVRLYINTIPYDMPEIFVIPNYQFDTIFPILHSAAARFGEYVGVYLTNPVDGSVFGRRFRVGQESNGWSDIITAVPTDMADNKGLSVFKLLHAGVTGDGQPYLVGRFWRNGDLDAGKTYSMKLHSTDYGLSFGFDRASVFSTMPHRFHLVEGNKTLYACSLNRICSAPAPVPFQSDPLTLTEADLKPFSASEDGASIALANGSMRFDDPQYAPYIQRGSVATLELGYYTGSGPEYAQFSRYIIGGIKRSYRDGRRTLTLELAHYGLFRVSNMSQPYYTELTSKSGLTSKVNDLSDFTAAPLAGGNRQRLVMDFWSAQPYDAGYFHDPEQNVANGGLWIPAAPGPSLGDGCATPQRLSANWDAWPGVHAYGYRLNPMLAPNVNSNPIVRALPVDVSVTFWSRIPDGVTGTDADRAYVALQVKSADGSSKIVWGTRQSTYRRTHLTYPVNIGGSSPVVLRFDSTMLAVGDEITGVITAFHANNDTIFYPERVEINNVNVVINEGENTAWRQSARGVEVPDFGRPYIMFASTPTSAKNFQVQAQFDFDYGSSPVARGSSVRMAWGLVCLAKDSQNYFVLRFVETKGANRLELLRVINGIEEAPLATSTAIDGLQFFDRYNEHSILLKHQDGHFEAYVYNKLMYGVHDWDAPALEFDWNRSERMIPWDEMRLGVYGLKEVPSAQICAFNAARAPFLAFLPGEEAERPSFPPSGTITINGRLYTYNGHATTGAKAWLGPFAYMGQWSGMQYTTDGTAFCTPQQSFGLDISLQNYISDSSSGSNWPAFFAGFLMSSDDGRVFYNVSTDWKPVSIAGDGTRTTLLDRSRFFVGPQSPVPVGLSKSNRVYLTGGLGTVAKASPDQAEYSHARGERAYLYGTDKINLYFFSAVSGDTAMTIGDLIQTVAGRSGAVASFPGDRVYTTLALTTTETEL